MSVCAYLGLGVMGGPMARHLGDKGHQVSVWNRSPEKIAAWEQKGGKGDPKFLPGVIAGAEFVFMCLGDDPDVADVFSKIEGSLRSGQIVVDHTTGSAGLARDLAKRCAAKGAVFLDAPVSGGQAGAENGQLTV